MAESISDTPITYPTLSRVANPYSGMDTWATSQGRTDIEIRDLIQGMEQRALVAQPDKGDEMRATLDVIFAPYRVGRITESSKTEQIARARLQHMITHHVAFALLDPRANDSFVSSMLRISELAEAAAQSELGRRRFDAGRFWSGAKAQTGVALLLVENGVQLVLPSCDRDKHSGGYKEIEEWDSKNGTDFVAVTPQGKVYLVDASGSRYAYASNDSDLSRVVTVKRTDHVYSCQPSLRTVLTGLGLSTADRITSLEIAVPSDPEFWGRGYHDPEPKTDGVRLNNMFKLNNDIARSIISPSGEFSPSVKQRGGGFSAN